MPIRMILALMLGMLVLPAFAQDDIDQLREKEIFRTGSLNPNVAKPSGRWSIDPSGQMVYGGDHSLTIRRTKEGLAMAHEILTRMGARRITSRGIPVNLNPRTRGQRLVGACRAGIDRKTSVVNPYFESHDVDNLFVCDNSVIPRVTNRPHRYPVGDCGGLCCTTYRGTSFQGLVSPP